MYLLFSFVYILQNKSCPWVGLGQDFAVFGGLDWVGSSIAKVLKI